MKKIEWAPPDIPLTRREDLHQFPVPNKETVEPVPKWQFAASDRVVEGRILGRKNQS